MYDFISFCLSVQNKPTLRRTSSELYVDKGKHDLINHDHMT